MCAIGAVTVDEVLDTYCTTGTVNEAVFCDFLEQNLLLQLMPFNGINPRSVVSRADPEGVNWVASHPPPPLGLQSP